MLVTAKGLVAHLSKHNSHSETNLTKATYCNVQLHEERAEGTCSFSWELLNSFRLQKQDNVKLFPIEFILRYFKL